MCECVSVMKMSSAYIYPSDLSHEPIRRAPLSISIFFLPFSLLAQSKKEERRKKVGDERKFFSAALLHFPGQSHLVQGQPI